MKNLSLTSLTLLTIVFITLKLTSVITWSWWWVLSPMIAEISIYTVGIIIGIVIYLPKKKKAEKPSKSRYQERLEEMQKIIKNQ